MTLEQSENQQFDIRGQICPSSLLVVLREVNKRQQEIKDGRQHLTLLTDNRDATTTIPEALINMGYKVSVTKEKSYYIITVKGQPPV